MLRLHVVPATGEPFDHPLEGEVVVIGRSANADLILEDSFLSREHARLSRQGDDWLVEDLGSRNGTFLNGERVESPADLGPGDVITLSGSTLFVQGAAEAGAGHAPASETPTSQLFRSASDVLSSLDSGRIRGEEALRRHADRLKLLTEVHQALGRPMTLDELLELILERISELLRPEEATVFLKAAEGEFYRAASRSVEDRRGKYFYSRSLIREVAEKGQAALVMDAQVDERFAAASSVAGSGVRSMVAAPLLDPDYGSLGMMALSSSASVRQFTEDDMNLLVAVASVAALKIRNVGLAEEAAERRRLEKELDLARQIQVALLPEKLPEVPGYEVYGGNVPSRGVSGDYYEVVPRRQGSECVFMLADVSGKGIAASLLTACLEALAAAPIEDGLPSHEICSRLSRLLERRTAPDKYATAFVAVLEIATGAVSYANAGHNPALVVRAAGQVERLGATGLPLGVMPGETYTAGEVVLAAGDLLMLYTDGIVEAVNPEDEEYGLGRLLRVCLRHRGESLEELAAAAEKDLASFVRGVPFADDRTVVLVRRLPAEDDALQERAGGSRSSA